MEIVLKYLQSRTDRKLPVNLSGIIKGKNKVVNNRLAAWAQQYGLGVINLHDLLLGRFYSLQENAGHRFRFVPLHREILVSKNYSANPEKYATTQQELLSAVKRTLSGEIKNVSYFHILDPVALVTLEWCVYRASIGLSAETKPHDVAAYKLPELRHALMAHGLSNGNGEPIPYMFHFNQREYKDAVAAALGLKQSAPVSRNAKPLPAAREAQSTYRAYVRRNHY